MLAKLEGISKKGKQRVKQHGETWKVKSFTDSVLFSTKAPGPWIHIESLDGSDVRIVSERDDPNFKITVEEDS